MRDIARWMLALVLADLVTGTAAFSLILLGAVGLAFLTGMSLGLTPLVLGAPIEVLVGLAMAATFAAALRGYRWIFVLARSRPIALAS